MSQVRMRVYCEIAERLVPRTFRTQRRRRAFVVLGNASAPATIAAALLDLGNIATVPGSLRASAAPCSSARSSCRRA